MIKFSVTDPECLSGVPDSNFPSRIQSQKGTGSLIRIRNKEFKYFKPKKLKLMLAEI
jgi:hypothetical protein